MINMHEVIETNKMIEQENLDVRTITLGINLLDCAGSDLSEVNQKIFDKITTVAKDLVAAGNRIQREYGIPIVNKRIAVTHISIGASCCRTVEDYVSLRKPLTGRPMLLALISSGAIPLVNKAMTAADELYKIHTKALSHGKGLQFGKCWSKNGIDMNAVKLLGKLFLRRRSLQRIMILSGALAGCILQCSDDNPFMAGAFTELPREMR